MEEENKEYRWETGYEKVSLTKYKLKLVIPLNVITWGNIRKILCIVIIDMGSNKRGLRWPAGSFGSRNDSKSSKKENDRKKRIQS